MLTGFGDAQPHRTVDGAGFIRGIAWGGDNANITCDFTLFRIVGHVVHIGPVERKGGVAIGESLTHILLKIFT